MPITRLAAFLALLAAITLLVPAGKTQGTARIRDEHARRCCELMRRLRKPGLTNIEARKLCDEIAKLPVLETGEDWLTVVGDARYLPAHQARCLVAFVERHAPPSRFVAAIQQIPRAAKLFEEQRISRIYEGSASPPGFETQNSLFRAELPALATVRSAIYFEVSGNVTEKEFNDFVLGKSHARALEILRIHTSLGWLNRQD